MSKDIQIHKGSNLNLEGEANKILVDLPAPKTFALNPDDFFNLTPKLVVKEGESRLTIDIKKLYILKVI